MRKVKKLLVSMVLLAMLVTLLTMPAQVGAFVSDSQKSATLKLLIGEGSGVTTEYLAKTSTRLQSAIISLRLLGKEAEALAFKGTGTFTDAGKVDWQGGKNILAYLKANPQLGWIGFTDGSFKPDDKIDAQAMHKVLLEILGYKQGADFTWEQVISFAKSHGFIKTVSVSTFANTNIATALIEALQLKYKGSGIQLIQKLVNSRVITKENAQSAEFSVLPASKVTLRYFTNSAFDKQEFDAAIPYWNAKNPDIKVECVILTGADSFDKIQTAIAGGEQIDVTIMENIANSFRDKAAKMYYLLNDLIINDYFNYTGTFGLYGKATMVGDDIFGMPRYMSPSAIYINKEFMDQAGLAMPNDKEWTLADYFAIIKKLAKTDANGKVTRYGGMHWQQTIHGNYFGITEYAAFGGWDIVNADGTPNANSPVLREVAQLFYNAVFVDKSMPSDADTKANNYIAIYDFMRANKFATYMGASNTALFLDIYKVLGYLSPETDTKNVIKVMFAPKWRKDSPTMTNPIVGSFAVAKTTKNPVEAFKFLKWLSTDSVVLGSKVAHRVPVWQYADKDTLINNWRYFADSNNKLQEGRNRKDLYLKALDTSSIPVYPSNRIKYAYSSLMLTELKNQMSLVFVGEKKIDDALNDTQKACQAIYEKEKGK